MCMRARARFACACVCLFVYVCAMSVCAVVLMGALMCRSTPLDLFRDRREALLDMHAAERRIVRDIVKAGPPAPTSIQQCSHSTPRTSARPPMLVHTQPCAHRARDARSYGCVYVALGWV
jgi:hypothetical protein